jgi:hypothetical protein
MTGASRVLLTDEQVAQFVTTGYLVIELPELAAVHAHIHAHLQEWSAAAGGGQPDPALFTELLMEPRVAGAMSSLLGFDFGAEVSDTWPGVHCHANPPGKGTVWSHRDSYADLPTPHRLNHLKCFYYPHAVGEENGPTVVFPETHFRTGSPHVISHYMNMRGQVPLLVAAGTYVLSSGALWHGAAPNISDQTRYMIKVDISARGPRTEPAWAHEPANMPAVQRILGAELTSTPNWEDWGKARSIRQRAWRYLMGECAD